MRGARKQPLYRKVNTTTHGVHHGYGGDYRDTRAQSNKAQAMQSMGAKQRRGLDYTPLFRFLLSKVGSNWDQVHSEAVARLDREEPIHWMVDVRAPLGTPEPTLRAGESSYWSRLYVDEDKRLRVRDPAITHTSLHPYCACCTHTFNGVSFTRKYDPDRP
jgi:hypothetical protein